MALEPFIPEYIRSLSPYIPGKPIEETQREFRLERVIKLASNENPLGPSPLAIRAVQGALQDSHRYPDGSAFHLKQSLSNHLGVSKESLIVGNGSNELIDFLIRTYCLAGESIVTSQAAFIAYRICAQIHGVNTLETPLTSDLRFDLEKMLEAARAEPKIRIVFIANPNNPTGTYVNEGELRKFLKQIEAIPGRPILVVLDYAYWEYVSASDLPDPIELMKEFPNLVVLRTFSKIYGLAGFRVGYAVAHPDLIGSLEKVRQPFNVNSLGLVAAQNALNDIDFVSRSRETNRIGMEFWESLFQESEIPYCRSQGNFILADVQAGLGKSGTQVYSECLKKGVIFRPVANYGLPGMLRISVGTEEENRIASAALLGIV